MPVRHAAILVLSGLAASVVHALAGCESCEFTPGSREFTVVVDLAAQSPAPVSLRVQLCTAGSAPSSCRDLTPEHPDAATWPATYDGDVVAHAEGTYCTFGTSDVEVTAANCDTAKVRIDDASLSPPMPFEVTLSCH